MRSREVHLTLLLGRASRAMNEQLSQSIRPDGVTPEHWRVLRLLSDEKGRAMGWMAEQLGTNPPTLTKLIDRMVGQSFVLRGADPEDSRRVLVYVTDTGLATLDGLQVSMDRHESSVTGLLGERNARLLERLLVQLIEGRPRAHVR